MGAPSGSREPSPDGLGPTGFDPGRKKSRHRPRDHFVKRRKSARPITFVRNRFYGKRANPVREPLKNGTGGSNPCFKPSNEASKADLREFHKEDLKLRRALYLRNPFAIGGAR
jgi:hypothetical protein